MKINLALLFSLSLFLISCSTQSPTEQEEKVLGNPAAAGFDEANSDEKAIAVADEVMEAMGGRANWDETQILSWNFFGRRKHYWNKATGDVRIESPGDTTTYLYNVFSKAGKVQKAGVEVTDSTDLQALLKRAEGMWINDSYWLVMPFKLKDSGVTLKYFGQDSTQMGKMADILELTFTEVGNTPNNKYLVYVDQEDRLVKQWDFFTNASDSLPRFALPWENYQPYGKILLSDNRGKNALSELAVYESLPPHVFDSFGLIAIEE